MAALIYNVTIKIDPETAPAWLDWMRDIHIPEVMASACFSAFRLLHLEGYDDEEGLTFAIQYTCPNEELFALYQHEYAPGLQAKHKALFEGRFVAFRTMLRVIAEG